MKILQINSADNWGGGEVHTVELCRQLQKNSCQIALACRPNSAIKKEFEKLEIPIVKLPLKGAIDILSAIRLGIYCRRNEVDIIHCHLARDYWLARCAKILYPKSKLVFTRHLLKPIRKNALNRWLFRKVDKVIAVSEAVKDSLLRQELMPVEKIVTIYNGININKFSSATPARIRKELKIDSDTKIIGIVGQISPHKGQETLIRSFPLIIERTPRSVLVVIGSDFSNGQYIKKLQELSETLGISNKLFFMGPRSDIPNLLKSLDVFVLASKNEPFGLVLLEAMASGTPIVATNAGGPKEIIINKESGLLVEPGDSQALAEAVLKILQNQDLREKFILQGLKRVKKFFSIEAMVTAVMHNYKQLLK